jgi:hypothetical protein
MQREKESLERAPFKAKRFNQMSRAEDLAGTFL